MTSASNSAAGAGVTQALARHAVEAQFTTADRVYARNAFVDTIGVMIAACAEPDAQPVIIYGRNFAGSGRSTITSVGGGCDPSSAAYVNGTLAHVLDYDDVSYAVKGHPSAVVVPTLIALGEHVDARGHDVLDAYLVAFDVGVAVGHAFDIVRHYRAGWHATSTIGVIEAAAAAGRLLQFDVDQMRHAIAMAASFAAGSRQNFGTATKPLHVGHAARVGVETAMLVASGATADPSQLEGRLGYFALFGGLQSPDEVATSLSSGPAVRRDAGLSMKKYPCCYHAHRAADAAIELSSELDSSSVRSVTVTTDPGGVASLIYPEPATPLQAKFSGPYIVATALIDGAVGLGSFTDEALGRPDVQALTNTIDFREDDVPPVGSKGWSLAYAVLRVEHHDGSVAETRIDIPRGDARNPLSEAELRDKFHDCLGYVGRGDEAADLWQRIASLADDGRLIDVLAGLR